MARCRTEKNQNRAHILGVWWHLVATAFYLWFRSTMTLACELWSQFWCGCCSQIAPGLTVLIIVALHQDSFAILWAKAGALRRIYGATREEQILALSALNDVAWQSNSEHVDPVWSIHYKIAKHTFLCSNVWFRNATWFLQSCELSSFRSICQSSHGMTSPCSWVSPGISSQRWA